jgi:outer membrane lipoprotein-sorting protein
LHRAGGPAKCEVMIHVLFLFVAVLMASPAGAVVLSAQDQAQVARVTKYLNGLTTLRSNFLQASSHGNVARGMLYLSRPGRMRFEYAAPSPLLLVADGARLVYQDNELEQTSILPLDATPLSVLVVENVSLDDGKLEVVSVQRNAGVLRVTVRMREDPEAGSVRMVFSDKPLSLRQWTITDPQGTEVRVALLNPVTGVIIDPKVFEIDTEKFEPTDPGR